MNKLLSDKEVLKIVGGRSKLVTYPELSQYSNIDELFGDTDKIILLYINKVIGNSTEGHWCLLTRCKRGKKIFYEFSDPYGYPPDDALRHYSKVWRIESGQDKNYLTKLLYDASLLPHVEIHYNELASQKDNSSVNTCGRHIGFRGKFHKVPLVTYQKMFKNLQNNGIDLDKAIVKLTDELL